MSFLYASKTDCVYKTVGDRQLQMTVISPLHKKYRKAPVYFLIPGGGWHSADRQSMIDFSESSVKALLENGFAVVSVEYRTVDGQVKISDVVGDCFDALGYFCAHSEAMETDTDRIVLSGHSAGGHLALLLAYADGNIFTDHYDFSRDPYKITAVAALSPATVLYEEKYPNTIGFGISHLFADSDDLAERKEVSPIEYVHPLCPPTALFAGSKDPLIDCNSSRLLYKALQDNSVDASLILSEGAGHSFEKVSDEEPTVSFEEIQEMLVAFVMKQFM